MTPANTNRRTKPDSKLPAGGGLRSNRRSNSQPQVHDPGGNRTKFSQNSHNDGDPNPDSLPFGLLPTTEDLAKSFLEAEPKEEKAQLHRAVARYQHLDESEILDESESHVPTVGMGNALSLPRFLASFLKGIGDRFQLKIAGIEADVCFRLDMPSEASTTSTTSERSEKVTVRLTIKSVDLAEAKNFQSSSHEGLKSQSNADKSLESNESSGSNDRGFRHIKFCNIKGILLSDQSTFATLSRSSIPSPPESTHAGSPSKSRYACDSQSSEMGIGITKTNPNIARHRRKEYPDDDKQSLCSEAEHLESLKGTISDSSLQSLGELEDALEPRYPLNAKSYNENDRFLSSSGSSNEEHSPFEYHSFQDLRDSNAAEPRARNYDITESEKGSRDLVGQAVHKGSAVAPRQKIGQRSSKDLLGSDQSLRDESPSSPPVEDLSESKIFSHEEAESMCMSAMSYTTSVQNEIMPGAWKSGTFDDLGAISSGGQYMQIQEKPSPAGVEPGVIHSQASPITIEMLKRPKLQNSQSPPSPIPQIGPHASHQGRPDLKSINTELQQNALQSSKVSEAVLETSSAIAKTFMSIDVVTLSIPQKKAASLDPITGSASAVPEVQTSLQDYDARKGRNGVAAGSPVLVGSSNRRDLRSSDLYEIAEDINTDDLTSLTIGAAEILSDMVLTRLTAMIVRQLMEAMNRDTITKHETGALPAGYQAKLVVDQLYWKFLDKVVGTPASGFASSESQLEANLPLLDSELLLKATLKGLDATFRGNENSSKSTVSVEKLAFGYSADDILSFDSSLKMRESTRDILAPVNKDIELTVNKDKRSSKIELSTLPLCIVLDLRRLDETFGWLGGFSSVLDLGNSMLSTVTVIDRRGRKEVSPKLAHAVRFDTSSAGESLRANRSRVQRKVTARIGGLTCSVRGSEASIYSEGTAVKIVSRTEGLGMQVDRLNIRGPFIRNQLDEPAMSIKLINTRIEYLPVPKEVDLARLLALLSPSKDKYELDDDILLDTLLRQRRQGGVIRSTAEKCDACVSKVEDLQHLSILTEELKKLSTVTKYFPEADRPGILVLGLIRHFKCEAQFVRSLGLVELEVRSMEAALITFPSLLALAINSVHLSRNHDEELLVDTAPRIAEDEDSLPMVMARFIGNEMEPIVKLKLQHICVEYHVSTLMAIMGYNTSVNTEDILLDLVNSVPTLIGRQQGRVSLPTLSSQTSSDHSKLGLMTGLLGVDLTIRDSVIGLNPYNSVAKGLLVLTETHLNGGLNKTEQPLATLEVSKAALMIIDSRQNIQKQEIGQQYAPQKFSSSLQIFESMGYVQVSTISAARASLRVTESTEDSTRSVDLEIRDNLFVLESCADSTQTLQTIFTGLKPPTPPRNDIKYRTEIVPVQDMLASFSGDAFASDEKAIGNDGDEAGSLGSDPDTTSDDQDMQSLKSSNSLYTSKPDILYHEMTDSMLEDDLEPSIFTLEPDKLKEDTSSRATYEQGTMTASVTPLDFQEDHFGSSSSIGGTAHRWNTQQNTYGLTNESTIRRSPLRVRARDVHVIWNLFDGYDWQQTRDVISQAVADVQSKALERLSKRDKRKSAQSEEDEESVIGDFLFNSIYIGVSSNKDPKDLMRQVNRNLNDFVSESESSATSTVSSSPSRSGRISTPKNKNMRLARGRHHKMTFELKGISADLLVFPPHSGETQSSIDIRIQDLEIFDHVPTSTWKKFATYMHDAGERESGTSMIHIEILNVQPVPELAASEVILKVGAFMKLLDF